MTTETSTTDDAPTFARPRRAPKVKLPRTLDPVPALVLGIDAGSTSGWATLDPAGNLEAGAVTSGAGIYALVLRVVARTAELGLPLVVVAEKWGGKWKSFSAPQGIGAAWREWEKALVSAGVPRSRIVKVYAQSWRAVVIGGKRSSEEWKKASIEHVLGRFHVELAHDPADAACMAEWGQHAGEVLAAMPKPKVPKVPKQAKPKKVREPKAPKRSRAKRTRSEDDRVRGCAATLFIVDDPIARSPEFEALLEERTA